MYSYSIDYVIKRIHEQPMRFDGNVKMNFKAHTSIPVINTRMTEQMRVNLMKEIDWAKKLQELVGEYLHSLTGNSKIANYNPYSFEFDNAALVTPTGFEWYQVINSYARHIN